MASYPWQHRFHAAGRGAAASSGDRWRARPAPTSRAPRWSAAEGGTEVVLTVTFLDGLLRYCLALGPDCRVVRLARGGCARFREMAEAS